MAALRLGAFLDGASLLDAHVGRQTRNYFCDRGAELRGDVGRLDTRGDVAPYRQHEIAITPPDNGVLEFLVDPCHLRDGNGRARFRRNGEVLEGSKPKTFLGHGAGDHGYEHDAFPDVGYGKSSESDARPNWREMKASGNG